MIMYKCAACGSKQSYNEHKDSRSCQECKGGPLIAVGGTVNRKLPAIDMIGVPMMKINEGMELPMIGIQLANGPDMTAEITIKIDTTKTDPEVLAKEIEKIIKKKPRFS